MQLRANPFRPEKPIDDFDLFAGRRYELSVLVRLLYQIRGHNPRHLAVLGDRGVGKSSFINQIQSLVDDSAALLCQLGFDSVDYDFRFLVFKHVASQHDTTETIVSALIHEMETKVRSDSFGQRSKKFLEKWKFTLQVPMVGSAEYQPHSSSEIGIDFVDMVASCWSDVESRCDGFVFIIDEVDKVALTTDIASFLKVTTEKFVDAKLNRIAVCLGGLTGAMEQLKQVHPSIGRVFEPIPLRPMRSEEGKEVVRKALESGADSSSLRFSPSALDEVVDLGGGFPALIQQLCFYAVEHDDDNIIDEKDVKRAIDEVVLRIKADELDSAFKEAGTGMTARILKALADHDDLNVSLRYISETLDRKQNEISSPITKLVRMGKVTRVERGVYSISDRLLRQYIRNLDILEELIQRENGEELAK